MPEKYAALRGREPRIAIAHDYLTQRGGAERVALALLRAFPGSELVTSIWNPGRTYPEFADYRVRTSPLSEIRSLRQDARRALPLLAPAWTRTTILDADVVICSSSGWSHGVRTTGRKIVYCHTPARWLYEAGHYERGIGRRGKLARRSMAPFLRRWDQGSAATADIYLANSSVVARRITQAYGRPATVVHPPVALRDAPLEAVPGLAPGYLLSVGRARGYKNIDVIARAVSDTPGERLVAVGGLPPGTWPSRLRGLSDVSDGKLRWLYQNAGALIACANEDFGLTPIEAYAAGTPALVLKAGGYLDTTVPGITGEFVHELSVGGVRRGIADIREKSYDSNVIMKHAETFSFDGFAARMHAIVDAVLADTPRMIDYGATGPGTSMVRGMAGTARGAVTAAGAAPGRGTG